MTNNKPFRFGDRIRSFKFAIEGILSFFKTEHNAWIHCVAATVVIIAGFVLKVTVNEWCWLIIAIAMVLITEMINTALEVLCDLVSPGINPAIKKIKDISAGAVLMASIAAVAIGLIVFFPRIIVL